MNPFRSCLLATAALLFVLMFVLQLPVIASPEEPTVVPKQCFPYFPVQTDDASITLHVFNPGTSSITVSIDLYKSDGTFQSTFSPLVAAGGIIRFDPFTQGSGLPIGLYSACVSSDEPFMATAYVENLNSRTIGVYAGTEAQVLSTLYLGPFFAGPAAPANSLLALSNVGSEAVTATLTINGGTGVSQTYAITNVVVPPNVISFLGSGDLADKVNLTDGIGSVRVDSTQPGMLVGVVRNTFPDGQKSLDTAFGTVAVNAATPVNVSRAFVPRLLVGAGESSATFSSHPSAVNLSISSNLFNAQFYRSDGTQAAPSVTGVMASPDLIFSIPLASFSGVGVFSCVIGSQGPLAYIDYSTTSAGAGFHVDNYRLPSSSSSGIVPSLFKDQHHFSVIGIQNSGTTMTNYAVTLYDASGATVHSFNAVVPAGATHSVDLREIAQIPATFVGRATILAATGGQMALQVDIYSTIVEPVSEVIVNGPAFALLSAPVAFTATVPLTASLPVSFTWSDGISPPQIHVSTVATDTTSFLWSTTGIISVTVSAENPFGSATRLHTVNVVADITESKAGQAVELAFQDQQGRSAMLDVPADAASPGLIFTMTPMPSNAGGTLPGQEATYAGVGLGVALNVFQGNQQLHGYSFADRAILQFNYTDVDIAGIDETTLVVLTQEGDDWVDVAKSCSPDGVYTRLPEQNHLEVEICHLSPFQLAIPESKLYLPTLMRS